ncbi:MAG: hypothetical protein COT81_01745 [Candidatus Buchananbacteria bacterium CG10_big_fil_rev_8_21_14_0_10_42_9]|uniref:Uncharacterized protein n=1 Tax=Candidatus Buchananbacteria bacterium CG10_big_fil_rev_8_21_14_0_10_42_9 TaxID=1974526 RepID=A0A2H0W1W2_9BACT|nr:MAG: hypothetical protein COT81_01745 [Candidatus Buchananbacteria bacterium CG10_big_fil_rev_8_21_14_0_10_42_9]
MATQLHVVTGGQYRKIDRRMREIKRQLDQDGGSPLDPDVVAATLQQIVEGNLPKDTLPTEMTIAGRSYDIRGFLEGNEKSVVGHTMVERVTKMGANLGQDDGQHFLKHQEEIPEALRGNAFIFTDWRNPDNTENVAYVNWDGYRWVQYRSWLGHDFYGSDRVLRRK